MALTPAFSLVPGLNNTFVVTDTTDYSEVNREDFAILLGLSTYGQSESYHTTIDPYADNEFVVNLTDSGIYKVRLYVIPAAEYEEIIAEDDVIIPETVSFSEAWQHSTFGLQEKLALLTLAWLKNRTHKSLELKIIFERQLESAQLYFYANMYSKSQKLFNQLNHGQY